MSAPIVAKPLYGSDRFVLLREAKPGHLARFDNYKGEFSEEDAKRLAAASDLLRDLEALIPEVWVADGNDELAALLERARATIFKARGAAWTL